jgi:4-hydroxy-tetrahydrodipicolinate synthase
MARIEWSGSFVVTVTPFAEDGSLELPQFVSLIETLIAEGADGIVVAGSTGEFFSISETEAAALYRTAVEAARGRITVIAGTTAIGTGEAQRLAQAAKNAGCDGGMLLPPPYVIPTERELIAHVSAVAEVGLPLMLYNNPTRTGVNLDARLLGKLTAIDQVVALKESSRDVAQFAMTLRAHRDRLAIFTGFESHVLPSMTRGGVGVVAMAPNVMGAEAVGLWRAAKSGNWTVANRVQERIDLLYAAMYAGHTNPYVVLKEAMQMLGRPGGHPRPPLLPMTAGDRSSLAASLRDLSLLPAATVQ